jgi:hypothetical protein
MALLRLLDTLNRRLQRQTSSLLLFTTMFLFQFVPDTLYTSLFSAGVGAGWHPGDPENHIPMIHLPLTRNSLHLPSGFSIFIFIASTVSLFDSQGDARHTTLFVSFLEGARSPSRARGLVLQDLGLKVYRYFYSLR